MEEILIQMKNVLNIENTGNSLSESLLTHVSGIARENRPILQLPIDVPAMTKKKCDFNS